MIGKPISNRKLYKNTFFLLAGYKVDFIAPCGANKSSNKQKNFTLAKYSTLCNEEKKVYFVSLKFDARAKRGQQS